MSDHKNTALPAYSTVREPLLAFHPERATDIHAHPLRGLLEFGPYSRSLAVKVPDPIRVASITPTGENKRINALLGEIERSHQPKERRTYLPDFPGFSRVFGARVVHAGAALALELPANLDEEISRSPKPHLVLAEKIVGTISAIETRRTEFDVLVLMLPKRWEKCFWRIADEPDFDLHDYIKAVTAARGIPIQLVLEEGALNYFCRCSVSWRLSIALYTKAGGTPWKLAGADPDTAFIGLSYAMKKTPEEGKPLYVTCCSQVFDADGGGLEFVAYETSDAKIYGKNPFLSRSDMRRVMARSLAIYQRRHAGASPKRVVVHKSTQFKPEEIDGCFDAWSAVEELDLIQIQSTPWRGVNIEAPRHGGVKGTPGGYPVERGRVLALGPVDLLLWTQGDTPGVVSTGGKTQHFYKEGKGIPEPLLITRHAGNSSWFELGKSILGLTKMDWNNDSLYDRLPVTLGYAQVLAGVVKRMPHLGPFPYQFRFFM